MKHRRWIGTVPAVIAVCGLGGAWATLPGLQPNRRPSATTRIADSRFLEQEATVQMALYAPTWLPHDGRPGPVGTRQGVHRILCDYTDADNIPVCILAQERRTPERDRYHEAFFQKQSDARAKIASGKTGYFVTGESGERRLFWLEPDMALVLSSSIMTDSEMLQVAASMRNR